MKSPSGIENRICSCNHSVDCSEERFWRGKSVLFSGTQTKTCEGALCTSTRSAKTNALQIQMLCHVDFLQLFFALEPEISMTSFLD
jgi:hypothetical protein